jgi:iron-sulfur cluster assembly protein
MELSWDAIDSTKWRRADVRRNEESIETYEHEVSQPWKPAEIAVPCTTLQLALDLMSGWPEVGPRLDRMLRMMISITPKAKDELRHLGVGESHFMRISVIPGGCSGMTYTAGIDSSLADGDKLLYDADGLRIVSDVRSSMYLDGLAIDFSDDLIHSGFRFTNPNASHSCGCGASFEV